MNNVTKISLTINLEGSTLVRKSEFEVIKYTMPTKDTKPSKKWRGKEGLKGVIKGVCKHYPLEAKPAHQHINMTEEAYKYMTSNAECPCWLKPKAWNSMSKKERLEAHLQRITEGLGGTSYTYQIFEN